MSLNVAILLISLMAAVVFLVVGLALSLIFRTKDNPDKAVVYEFYQGRMSKGFIGYRSPREGDTTFLFRYRSHGKKNDLVISKEADIILNQRGRRVLTVKDGALIGDSICPTHPQPVSRTDIESLTQTDALSRYGHSISSMVGSKKSWVMILIIVGVVAVGGFILFKFISGGSTPDVTPGGGDVQSSPIGWLINLVVGA